MKTKSLDSRCILPSPYYRRRTRLRDLMRLLAVPLLFLLAPFPLCGQSALDGFDPNVNGSVYVVVIQKDGKTLLGGNFTTISSNGGDAVARNRIARLNPDGTLDTAFNPNADSSVRAIAVQANGDILVGGSFTSIGGQTRNRIARLNATTGLADSFDPNAMGANAEVYSIAVEPDGKILGGGTFTSIGGQPRNYIARLDGNSGLADSFDPNASAAVRTIALQANGKILLGGDFISIGGQKRNHVARLDGSTGLADSFDPNASGAVCTLALQADGSVLLGGNFTNVGGQARNRIARVAPTTGVPDSFDPAANNDVTTIAVQADGKIVVGGFFTNIGGEMRKYIARVNAITGLVESIAPNSNGPVLTIALQADGKVVAGGDFTEIRGEVRNRITRLEANGTLDRTLNPHMLGLRTSNPNNFVGTSVIQPDGKILIGGRFSSVLGVERNNIARLNADGTLDLNFHPNPNNSVYTVIVLPDGKIGVGGYFTNIGGQTRRFFARLDPVTGLADSFDPNPDSGVYSLAVQADGKIVIGGDFTNIGGQARGHIARLNPITGLADSFNPEADGVVWSLAIQGDGKILAAGLFGTIGAQQRRFLARLDATTGLADSFDANAGSTVDVIAVQPDGKILAGGWFYSMGGHLRNKIARLDPITGLVDSFNPNVTASDYNAEVFSIAVQADGKIMVGGIFTNIGGQERNGMARLDPTTGLPDSFNTNLIARRDFVGAIAFQADGKILVGGSFASICGQNRNLFARLTSDTAALQTLSVTQSSIIWARGGSGPQFTRVVFEYSTNGEDYFPLGNGIATGSSWTLLGLNLPTDRNIFVRARGYYRNGVFNCAEGVTESVRNVFLAGGNLAHADASDYGAE